jgi:hypothetical protein
MKYLFLFILILSTRMYAQKLISDKNHIYYTDIANLLKSGEDSLDTAQYIIGKLKLTETNNESITLSKLDNVEYDIVMQVAWHVIAMSEYCKNYNECKGFYESVKNSIGEIMVPSYICFLEDYSNNYKYLALRIKDFNVPLPGPTARPMRELINQASLRLIKRTVVNNPDANLKIKGAGRHQDKNPTRKRLQK